MVCELPQDAASNTLRPAIPFVGIVAHAFEDDSQTPDDLFGKPIGAIQGKYAIGGAPEGSTRLNPRLVARALSKILGWRLRGQAWPHPYFSRATGAPSYLLATLSQLAREALRPHPAVHPTWDYERD